MRIRSARNDDLKACLELDASYETEIAWQVEELHGEKEWGMRFREIRLPRKQTLAPAYTPEERLVAWQRRDAFWVAVEHNKIMGYLTLVVEAEHRQARIGDLVVAPDFRRKGIAEKLLEYAITWCLRRNVEQLILECTLKAQPAIAFAQKQRFVACGFQEAYWPGQEMGLFFRRRI